MITALVSTFVLVSAQDLYQKQPVYPPVAVKEASVKPTYKTHVSWNYQSLNLFTLSSSCPFYDWQNPQPYSFNYEVKDSGYSNFGQAEVSDSKGYVSGSYHVLLPDGRHQYVTYKDEGYGLVAEVTYKGESTYPEYQTPTKTTTAGKKTATQGSQAYNTNNKESTHKKPSASIKATPSYEKPTGKESTYKSASSASYLEPRYVGTPEAASKKVIYGEPIKKPINKEPVVYTTPTYKAPVTSRPSYEKPENTTPVSYKPTYSTTAAYQAPVYNKVQTYKELVTTTPAYKESSSTTAAYKVPVYQAQKEAIPTTTTPAYRETTTTQYKAPVYQTQPPKPAYKVPEYSTPKPVYKTAEYTTTKPVYKVPEYSTSSKPTYSTVAYNEPVSTTPAYQTPVYRAQTYKDSYTTVYKAPAVTTQSYKEPSYTTTPAYKAPTYTTTAYQSPVYSTVATYMAPASTTPAYKESATAANYKTTTYATSIPTYNKEPINKAPTYVYKAPSIPNKAPSYKPLSYKMNVYKPPAYKVVNTPSYPSAIYRPVTNAKIPKYNKKGVKY